MTVEICAFSLESCLVAQASGAKRIELCGGAAEGGTTPSSGLIQLARNKTQIDLYVMIRPRGGDFLYSDTEFEVMKQDIETAKKLGANGLVFGLLNPDGTVDETRTRELVELASPLPVTFHRAFDVTRDPLEALEAVIRTGAKRILTSGQQSSVDKGLDLLAALVKQAAGRIEIMAGAGVNARNAAQLAAAGVDALHLTGKAVRPSAMTYRRPDVPMASVAVNEYELVESNEDVIRAVIEAVA